MGKIHDSLEAYHGLVLFEFGLVRPLFFHFAKYTEEGSRASKGTEGWEAMGFEMHTATFCYFARTEEGNQDEEF